MKEDLDFKEEEFADTLIDPDFGELDDFVDQIEVECDTANDSKVNTLMVFYYTGHGVSEGYVEIPIEKMVSKKLRPKFFNIE